MNPQRCIFAALILTLVLALPAAATLTVYTNRNAWAAAIGGSVLTDDFSGDPVDSSNTPFTTSKGVVFTALSGNPITIQILGDGLVNGSRELHFRDFGAGVRVTLPNNGRGFGFDYDTAVEPWTVQVGDHTTILPANTNGFVGYVDDASPINSFTLKGATGVQGGISLDNLSRSNNAGEMHNEGVKFVLEHLTGLPRREDVNAVALAMTQDYCASIDQDCHWLKAPAKLPRDPQILIYRLQGSRPLRDRAKSVFDIVAIMDQRPRNARSLRRFERTLNHLESSYRRPLNATDSVKLSNLVSVGGSSGKFWASRREGGLEGISNFAEAPAVQIDWVAIVVADIEGCIWGMETVPVPIPEVETGACIAGAILFSSIEAINQLY
jgi:hypothetical protein